MEKHMPVQSFLKQKRQSKKELSKTLSIVDKKPFLGMIIDSEISEETQKMLLEILKGLENVNLNVVVLMDCKIPIKEHRRLKILPYNRNNRKLLLEAVDMALVFSFNDVEEMLLHGTIPISPIRPEVKDYDPNKETGNAFIYEDENPWSIFAALVRAVETFKFTYDWKHIVRQGVESVCDKET